MKIKNYTYIILPLLIVVFFLIVAYFGNQWYIAYQINKGNMEMASIGVNYSYIFESFNNIVPFWPWTVYPYIIAYPFWTGTFIYISIRSKDSMYTIMTMAIITFIICGIWYFFWQSTVYDWRFTSGIFLNNDVLTPRTDLSFEESIVLWIYRSAMPLNAMPSLHTLMSWLCVIALRMDKKIPTFAKIIIWVLSLSIIISTQTIKQHYIIDVIVGLALAEASYWVLRNSRIVKVFAKWVSSFSKKLRLE
ncbi:MAG: phosphatase PAP2 family protein [Candidatus Izemoplasmatales bacterium]|nr:phosphatase PAP2 family protein [Candidatus Izemoplasmatales bacterium]